MNYDLRTTNYELRTALLALAALAAACGRPAPSAGVPEPMPTLRVEQVAGGEAITRVPAPEGVLAALRGGERVTLTVTDADLRAVLAALAEAAGVSLVVSPEVRGRVTVRLEDVPALEALAEVVRGSGHMIAEPLRAPWGPTVFYVAPVNVDTADEATLRARFGVSPEMARFIVRSRAPLN